MREPEAAVVSVPYESSEARRYRSPSVANPPDSHQSEKGPKSPEEPHSSRRRSCLCSD